MDLRFLTITWRDLLRFVRFKSVLVASLLQPALWLAFFGIGMASSFDRFAPAAAVVPGMVTVGYLTFMCAGVIALTTLFTSLYGGIIFLFDKNWGLLREIVASPLPRGSIIVGIALSGVTKSYLQAIVITGFGLLLGVEFFAGFGAVETVAAVAGMLVFVGVFALGFLFLSSAIAVTMETPEGLQAVITLLTLPIFFASNALYPTATLPDALRALAAANPLTHLITGLRYFAIGPDFSALGVRYVTTAVDVVFSLCVLLVFAALTFLLARWRFARVSVT
ncbi:ABC-2 type transport system permease protein [Methanofollis sp. W23]|uniref:ABC transporter permease n=1 Tax=Methanofollis sp. W23 TaxID=2817849 RepID=UPI001AEA3FD9|nr:ABC transporter permease [Methanofollis sp. W23]MBP2146145.1 ABC-2 type transport system permease protein [Methanofollis sp. W23]